MFFLFSLIVQNLFLPNNLSLLTTTMPNEIERKYTVKNDAWRPLAHASMDFVQGYFQPAGNACLRIRIINGSKAKLTIKANDAKLTERPEFEYDIPLQHAKDMLKLFCGNRIVHKTRYLVQHDGQTWEVDEFLGRHAPLIIAEIELTSPDETFNVPDWADRDVSGNRQLSNEYLATH